MRLVLATVVEGPAIRISKLPTWIRRCVSGSSRQRKTYVGITTPHPEESVRTKALFHFDTGYAVLAKRPSRPFPPPFFSPPSGSFSDPLSTQHSAERRAYYHGQMIRGVTNGDDAVLAEGNLICAIDLVQRWLSWWLRKLFADNL